MTAFISSPNTPVPLRIEPGMNAFDDQLQPPDYRLTYPQTSDGLDIYSDVLWPRSSFPGEPAIATNGFVGADSCHQAWEWNFPNIGSHTPKLVSGIVKDANGNPVSGATVQLFNTATGLLVDTQISGSDGRYRCGDPNAVTCFAVGYLVGSPDTEGTTVNTLTGT